MDHLDNHEGLSRRSMLAAAGASTIPGIASAARPTAAPPPVPPRTIIDFHTHVKAPGVMAAHRADIAAVMPGFTENMDWTLQWTLDDLDKNGGRASVLTNGNVWYGDGHDAPEMSRIANEYGAGLVRDYPGRFAFLATVPQNNVDATLKEIAYAYDVLKLDGIAFTTSVQNRYPGEPAFLPIWQELNRRKALVYFHPGAPECCTNTVKGLQPSAVEFMYDNTRAIASLLMNLVFTNYPDIRWVFSHGGGALPTLADRLDWVLQTHKEAVEQMRGGPMGELRRLNFDTASVANPGALAGLTKLVPTTQILFGTDFPYDGLAHIDKGLRDYGFNAEELADIRYRNALRLIPRLNLKA